jgi:hypothetical protein
MAAPDDSTANGAGGILNGHGVGIALAAIFVGMGLVVTFVASDGAIFGLNFRSSAGDRVPASSPDTRNGDVLSSDVFDKGSGDPAANASSQPGTGSSSVVNKPPERSPNLSEDERQLMAMRDFPWDSIVGRYIVSNQKTIDKFEQQNVVKQKPMQSGSEPLSLSDRIAADVDRNTDRERNDDSRRAGSLDIEAQINRLIVQRDVSENDQPGGSGDQERPGNSGSNSTNNTSIQGSTENSGSDAGNNRDGGNSTRIEAIISLG